MKPIFRGISILGFLWASSFSEPRFYLGASQENLEGGYSGGSWSLGLGVRASAHGIDRPSALYSNGEIEITAYYLRMRLGAATIRFGHEYRGVFVFDNENGSLDAGNAIGLVKAGIEIGAGEAFGIYWDCAPVYVDNVNLLEWGGRDFNRIGIGLLNPKIGIRLYF